MANNFMKTAPSGVVYGAKRKKTKRRYPERRKPHPSRAGIEMAAQSKDKTMCESEAIDIHRVRKAFDLPCKDCKYKDTKYCRWM